MRRLLLTSLLFSILLTVCPNSRGGETYLPAPISLINSLAVVIDNDLWKGSVGDIIHCYFAAPIDGLPNEEPTFSLHQVSPQVFEGDTHNSRNVLIVNCDSQSQGAIEENMYVKPQVVAVIEAKKVRGIACKIEEYYRLSISAFRENGLTETRHHFQKSLNTEAEYTRALGTELRMSSFYKIVEYEGNFLWIECPIKGDRANVILYEMSLRSIPTDEGGCAKAIIEMRDSIGEKHIPGPKEGMHIVTETCLAPSVSEVKIESHFALESEGLWEAKNLALGDPYINHIIKNKTKNRLLVARGFLYASGIPERDVLFELEAIVESIGFDDQQLFGN